MSGEEHTSHQMNQHDLVQASEEDDHSQTRTFHINDHERNKQYNYKSNYIRTTKYTAISYLPFCLLTQFRRFANIYFLIIAVLQSIAIISPLSPITAILPLVFVVAVSMIREGVEDYIRYRSDKGKCDCSDTRGLPFLMQ